jgi:glutathione S-transferase
MNSFLPSLGVDEATAPVIEDHLAEMLDVLGDHFREHRFLMGDRIALGDCSLAGPFYAHLYMVQRVCDAYRGLDSEDRLRVDAALAGTGIGELLALPRVHRVAKRDFKLLIVD